VTSTIDFTEADIYFHLRYEHVMWVKDAPGPAAGTRRLSIGFVAGEPQHLDLTDAVAKSVLDCFNRLQFQRR
jgi:hypothetical protein